MSKVSLTGKWLVKSVYGDSYSEKNAGKINLWEFDAIEVEGEFSGIGIDISDAVFSDEKTKIEGFIENDLLSFSRKYQHKFIIEDDGITITKEENNPYEVNYEGVFNEFLNCFQGVWSITDDQAGFILDGTFEMKLKQNK